MYAAFSLIRLHNLTNKFNIYATLYIFATDATLKRLLFVFLFILLLWRVTYCRFRKIFWLSFSITVEPYAIEICRYINLLFEENTLDVNWSLFLFVHNFYECYRNNLAIISGGNGRVLDTAQLKRVRLVPLRVQNGYIF